VAAILADSAAPAPIDEDTLLASLQSRPFPAPAPYRYDALSLWLRAAERVARLASLGVLADRPLRVLEACGGDGMVSRTLADMGHDVVMIDQRDWRHERASAVNFRAVDVDRGLPFDDAQFDLILSYNAFEHIGNPPGVLTEMVRVCRPSGRVVLDFGPLFASPFGLHAWSLNLPWPQYLLSTRLLEVALRAARLSDLGTSQDALQPTNHWRLDQFRSLWRESGCRIEHLREDEDHRFLDLVTEFPAAFRGRGLGCEDLIKNSIEIVLARPDGHDERRLPACR
jgi:SAM-dependent methyltransferase